MPATAITGSVLRRSLRAYQVCGANTGVGKTVMSTILCEALHRALPQERVWYLKPVSTGPQQDADAGHLARFSPLTSSRTLAQYGEPVSPHIAARTGPPLADSAIRDQIQQHVAACAGKGPGTLLLETAGGVHSPTPSGSSQADLYRPLRLPVLLVGDPRLGGISSSIAAFESLHIRGYDLSTVLVFEDAQYENHLYLRDYFAERGIPLLSLPPPPAPSRLPGRTLDADRERMAAYYEAMSARPCVLDTIAALAASHAQRLSRLEAMAPQAHKHIWYPFTQHNPMTPASIMTIDSAHGDFFQTYSPAHAESEIESEIENALQSTLDGSASWWTQGLGHGSPALALAAAHAAGRYGHVMFASAIHEPALSLAELLLKHLGNPRMQRVFYSDNGSTGVEVAVKMALTAASERYGYGHGYGHGDGHGEVGVLGLKGSYHGDTIGAMDCSEPSAYNKRVHWYQGRGHWFDFPQVTMRQGSWVVEPPAGLEDELGPAAAFASLDEVFDLEARGGRGSAAAARYTKHILRTLDRLVRTEGRLFGALIMEPVMLGAGGMRLVDPLFQRTLVSAVRASHALFASDTDDTDTDAHPHTWSGLPVVFDEVFTGLTRLGPFTPSALLDAQPDISVHAKLLTGGLVPLAATVASEAIYSAFLGREKSDALLHGHSYTAHAVGCAVAEASVKELLKREQSGAWDAYKAPWREASSRPKARAAAAAEAAAAVVWSMWSPAFLAAVSHRAEVEGVVALGSVLAITLRDANPGYEASTAVGLQAALSRVGGGFGIHSRVLGNVFYVMASQTTEVDVVRRVEERVLGAL